MLSYAMLCYATPFRSVYLSDALGLDFLVLRYDWVAQKDMTPSLLFFLCVFPFLEIYFIATTKKKK